MIDRCPKCNKQRRWKAGKDRHGRPFFRRVSTRGQKNFCWHVLPLRIDVWFPPEGIL